MPFITITETVCEGRIPAWKDDNGYPVIHTTREEAEAEANDPELRKLAEENGEEYEPDTVVEVIATDEVVYDAATGEIYWRI